MGHCKLSGNLREYIKFPHKLRILTICACINTIEASCDSTKITERPKSPNYRTEIRDVND
jgi:hypothetical protein